MKNGKLLRSMTQRTYNGGIEMSDEKTIVRYYSLTKEGKRVFGTVNKILDELAEDETPSDEGKSGDDQ